MAHMGEPTVVAAEDVALRIALGGEPVLTMVIEIGGRDANTIHIQGRLGDLLHLTGGANSRLSQISKDFPHLRMAAGTELPPEWPMPRSG
jgi:hypothetical protein